MTKAFLFSFSQNRTQLKAHFTITVEERITVRWCSDPSCTHVPLCGLTSRAKGRCQPLALTSLLAIQLSLSQSEGALGRRGKAETALYSMITFPATVIIFFPDPREATWPSCWGQFVFPDCTWTLALQVVSLLLLFVRNLFPFLVGSEVLPRTHTHSSVSHKCVSLCGLASVLQERGGKTHPEYSWGLTLDEKEKASRTAVLTILRFLTGCDETTASCSCCVFPALIDCSLEETFSP